MLPSKTQRKHEMHALQALGVDLVALDPARLASLALPEPLVDAIATARTLARHEARRRQMQYIGRLMRDVDPEPIRAALAAWKTGKDFWPGEFDQVLAAKSADDQAVMQGLRRAQSLCNAMPDLSAEASDETMHFFPAQ